MGNIYEIELPEVNDEFAKAVGQFQSVEELKNRFAKIFQQERELREDQRYEGRWLRR